MKAVPIRQGDRLIFYKARLPSIEPFEFFGSSSRHGGRRKRPNVFTEQGVALLSSVLRSERAIPVNLQIMRTFVRLQEIRTERKDVARKLSDIEKKLEHHSARFQKVQKQIKKLLEIVWTLMTGPEKPGRRIGFQN